MSFYRRTLLVNESPIEGKGLYSSVSISEGEPIMIIDGEEISGEECERREEEENNVYIFWNGDTYIDVMNTEDIKYINHHCAPNCFVETDEDNNLVLYALQDIQPGDELTIDYGYDEIYEICSCSSCRVAKSGV